MAKLYFYYSAMNAGKTTTLLQSAHNYRERGMRVLIFTPRLDTRAGAGTVASRIGLSAEGVAFERDDDLERRIRAEVTGAAETLRLRKSAIEQYRTEVNQAGVDLNRIVRVAYQEGEVGILELLDSYRVTRQALLRLVDLEALAKESQIELDRAVGEEVLP